VIHLGDEAGVGWGGAGGRLVPTEEGREYPAGGGGGSKNDRVWGSGLPEGAVTAQRRPTGASAGEGHQGTGATTGIGIWRARTSSAMAPEEGGGISVGPLSCWEIGGGGYVKREVSRREQRGR
jgi:hypothetical protein